MTSPFQGLDTHYNENNLDPDFILRYIPSREKFAVEAKFRSNRDNQKSFNDVKTIRCHDINNLSMKK